MSQNSLGNRRSKGKGGDAGRLRNPAEREALDGRKRDGQYLQDGYIPTAPAIQAMTGDDVQGLEPEQHRQLSAVRAHQRKAALEQARLAMRPFTDAFLAGYVAGAGPGICRSVGAYEIEGRGIDAS